MIYPSDFDYHPNKFIKTVGSDIPPNNVQTKKLAKEPIWFRYFNNSTVHGFRYLTDPTIRRSEQITWGILVTVALVGVLYVCYLLQVKFYTNVLATVVETTFFPVYEIPFPAITICNNNRINWKRVPAAIDFYLPTANNETISKLNEVIIGLNSYEFGSFGDFDGMKDMDMSDLDHINLTQLYGRVIYRCEDMFEKLCWWRNRFVDCCNGTSGLFVMQKSEYGLCYAFNSVLNVNGIARYNNERNYPWRVSSYGEWSGLRVNLLINASTNVPPSMTLGVLIMVNHPFSWPDNAYFIPARTSTAVIIKPAYSYATTDVKNLSPVERQCLYADEKGKYNFQTLPGTLYFRTNCLCECRQRQMIKSCNCTLDFLYPTGDYPKCNASNLKCLNQFDAMLNFERPPFGNPYFSDEEEGFVCDCLPECESIDYGFNMSPIQQKSNVVDGIIVDIHFQQSCMVKYRTDVEFGWLDLMVAFGGIAGLFLGCSLLSVAEAMFFLVIGLKNLFGTKCCNCKRR